MNNQSIFLEVIISKLIVVLSGVATRYSNDNAVIESANDIPNTLSYVQQLIVLENKSVDIPLILKQKQS
jgi:hypothetical protein